MSEVPKYEINNLEFFLFGFGHVTPSFVHYSNENDPCKCSQQKKLIIWSIFNLDVGTCRMCPQYEITVLQIKIWCSARLGVAEMKK